MVTLPHIEAANLFAALLPEVVKYDRDRRMADNISAEEIRTASDNDLAVRLRMKRKK